MFFYIFYYRIEHVIFFFLWAQAPRPPLAPLLIPARLHYTFSGTGYGVLSLVAEAILFCGVVNIVFYTRFAFEKEIKLVCKYTTKVRRRYLSRRVNKLLVRCGTRGYLNPDNGGRGKFQTQSRLNNLF